MKFLGLTCTERDRLVAPVRERFGNAARTFCDTFSGSGELNYGTLLCRYFVSWIVFLRLCSGDHHNGTITFVE